MSSVTPLFVSCDAGQRSVGKGQILSESAVDVLTNRIICVFFSE